MDNKNKKPTETDNLQIKKTYLASREIIPDTISAIEQLYHRKESCTGISTGFTDLDNMISGFQNSEFIIIGAQPSIGKTAFALTIAANMAINNKIPVGFFTLEMSGTTLLNRLIASESRISSINLRSGLLKPTDFDKFTEASGRIYEAPLYIDDTPNMKLSDLITQARIMKTKEGIEIIFIDYISLIETESECKISRYEQLSEISRSLKSLTRELNIPIVCLSHLGRQSKNKPPTLANLRKLGSIDQDADVVLFLHRDSFAGSSDEQSRNPLNIPTELIIAKQRNGPLGTIPILFLPKYTRFENFSKDSS